MEEEEERHGTHDCEYSREGEREKKKRIEERRRERERDERDLAPVDVDKRETEKSSLVPRDGSWLLVADARRVVASPFVGD